MDVAELVFNGIDATSGEYAHPPLSLDDVRRLALGLPCDATEVAEADGWRRSRVEPHLDVRHGLDARDPRQVGWGVIFAHNADPAVREALGELLKHRQRQAQRHYRELSGGDGYQPGESKLDFLARHGAGPGPADPERVPYYLLLVGGPDEIPYSFQTRLGVQYAVGRLAFATPRDYERYARSVIEAETTESKPERSGRIVFFGVCNPDDRTTGLTSQYLVRRVAAFLAADQPSWHVETLLGEATTKQQLSALLNGDGSPALLFTASHGMSFPAGDPRQEVHQGALLCQDWPGPKQWRGAVPEAHYFSADDLESASKPAGLITFCYACHGAGTPRLDAYARPSGGPPRTLAPAPFVARLPQRLLARGALAAVGHVERSWGYSFLWKGAGGQSQVFEDTLKRLLEGHPVGDALEPFHLRYAELAVELAAELEHAGFGTPSVDPELLPRLWTATADARNYVILGDPAVRLPGAGASGEAVS